MGKLTLKRTTLAWLVLLTAVLLILILGAGKANAAFGDRSSAGSVMMPADKTLELAEGVETKVNFGNDGDYMGYYYYRIKPKKTGYITFTNDFSRGSYIALCDANKKMISRSDKSGDDLYAFESETKYHTIIHYGVQKGKTYHIRCSRNAWGVSDLDGPNIGSIKWTNSAVKANKFGKTKKKAVEIKRNKAVKGLFVAGNTKAQWFKFKAKKNNRKLYLKADNNCGTITAEVKKMMLGIDVSTRVVFSKFDDGWKKSYGLVPISKGTQYIKVYPEYKSSGAYTLKWK